MRPLFHRFFQSINATVVVSVLLGAPTLISAQTIASPGAPSLLAQKIQANAQAQAFFDVQDFANGEKTLEAANRQPAGTPQWNLESGCSLSCVASKYYGSGARTTSATIAQLALQQLTQATQRFTARDDPAEVASAYELAGTIYEQMLGDRATAEKYYATAVQLAPNAGQAAWRLARLKQSDAEAAKKIARKGH